MKKMMLMIRESLSLVRKHKIYFLLPLLLFLAVLTLLAFQVGPGIAISFIYAGI
jgi:ABC-type transport system involved in cytochrome c biogenesis permease component